ncbi:hypothetical protein MXD63_26880 [Frankia sp. Cpl3]|nr:hypothetical protein [Parafrankia colletiae]MCK9903662.1 hypothetical protein [Frankia sp. Cpl3]
MRVSRAGASPAAAPRRRGRESTTALTWDIVLIPPQDFGAFPISFRMPGR